MRKLLFITILLLFCSHFMNAQGRYDNCYFGTAGLNFSDWTPHVLTNSQMDGSESPLSISTKDSDLLFYSNGGNSPTAPSSIGAVWNANHVIMENGILGDSSGCLSSYQGAVAFPVSMDTTSSLNTSKYYIFMRDCVESSFSEPYYNSGLTYCKIDMDANNGLGKVVSKNNIVVPFDGGSDITTNREPVAAILNENNLSWWVFSYNSDSLYSVEVDANGVGNYRTYEVGIDAIIFSPARDHVMVGKKLYAFNASNGDLSYLLSLPETKYAFSSNGKFLYGLGSGLNQYDVTAADILNSKVTITTGTVADNLYLAPDTRIYLFNRNATSLPGAIDCPNSKGVNCGLSMNSIYLGGRESGEFFTNIPANFLYHERFNCNASVSSYSKQSSVFEVYPNPSNGQFTITVNTLEKPQPFQIVSIEGKVVFNGLISDYKEEVDLSFIEAGVYFVEVMGRVKRIVVE